MVCLTELQHLLDSDEDGMKSVTVTEKASLSLDHFWWRVGQGSHIQQAPHPPGKHVWGEALILDCLTLQVKSTCIYLVSCRSLCRMDCILKIKNIWLCVIPFLICSQGSYSKPWTVNSSPPGSVCMESSLKGLQLEVSETCTLCLSRLFSVLKLDKAENVSLHSPLEKPPTCPPPLFKFKLSLEDVNTFTLSNVAGKK